MARVFISLAGIALVAGMVPAAPAEAGQCHCRGQSVVGTNRSFSYQSGPAGICSVAEDVGLCASSQIQISPDWPVAEALRGRRGRMLAEALGKAKVSLAPAAALSIAGLVRPEAYGDALPDVLSAVLALSLSRQVDRLTELHAALAQHGDAVRKPFASREGWETVDLGAYRAVVSYGCIEVSQGTFVAVARTPFAASGASCGP